MDFTVKLALSDTYQLIRHWSVFVIVAVWCVQFRLYIMATLVQQCCN